MTARYLIPSKVFEKQKELLGKIPPRKEARLNMLRKPRTESGLPERFRYLGATGVCNKIFPYPV